ncbi:uncharacterized protein CANTADRAFT_46098 [Suhomyces tanzawaensis NRRL Y-17324]|uniref:Derlin n=1 Tax=Suhomyces tanzawaensis NRRL Y-17324 TaxID=984487 RepID=A0A1E4SPM4_9ASCO|nr:uncharacterized protein CANTADRAFT_46098 [Suhomyces tanzawaensis NRRL Y-17324]ODV81438.1 hypothetical protein CANTADRAFT_46098 [Suhomyces tanzawaensis NRRL Y-17324]
MDLLLQWVRAVPPVTRGWVAGILMISILIKLRLVSKTNLAFIPERAFGNEPWRLVTTFFLFDEFSFEMIYYLWSLERSSRMLESAFMSKLHLFPQEFKRLSGRRKELVQEFIDRNRSLDYLYYALQICASIAIVNSTLYYKIGYVSLMLGVNLNDILLYISCREDPDAEVNLMWVIRMRAAYLPWCITFFNLLFFGNILNEVVLIFAGNFSLLIPVLKSKPLVTIYVTYSLAHFWWFLRSFLLGKVYHDSNDRRRELREKTLEKYNVNSTNYTREAVAWFLLPPWYWFYFRQFLITTASDAPNSVASASNEGNTLNEPQFVPNEAENAHNPN